MEHERVTPGPVVPGRLHRDRDGWILHAELVDERCDGSDRVTEATVPADRPVTSVREYDLHVRGIVSR